MEYQQISKHDVAQNDFLCQYGVFVSKYMFESNILDFASYITNNNNYF